MYSELSKLNVSSLATTMQNKPAHTSMHDSSGILLNVLCFFVVLQLHSRCHTSLDVRDGGRASTPPRAFRLRISGENRRVIGFTALTHGEPVAGNRPTLDLPDSTSKIVTFLFHTASLLSLVTWFR